MSLLDRLRNKKNVQEEIPSATYHDRVSGIPFPAYRGKEPYMFISYAHVDSPMVYQIISEFNDMGYNVWYDEGIEPGIEWPEEIANALNRCCLFVVFITPIAADSSNVRNEINFALSKKLPFIAIHIKETTLTPGLQLQMGSKQAILKYDMDDESFRRKYTYSFETVLKPTLKHTKAFTEPIAFSPEEDFEIVHGLLRKYHGNGKDVKLPAAAQIIGGFAFNNCQNLESIVMSDECGAILDNAFVSCPELRNITFGKSFRSLSEKAFIDCPNVRFSYYKDKMPETDKSIISKIDTE